MSLTVDGTWLAGVWNTTVWADGVWLEGAAPSLSTPTAGGGTYPKTRYRTEKEIRDERIARGIIPPDEPEMPVLIESAKEPTPTLAKRKLRQLVEGHIRLAELERLLNEVIQAQQIADEFAYQDMLRELERNQRQLVNLNNQTAIIVMLGLL